MSYANIVRGVRCAELARRRVYKWQRVMREANQRGDIATIDKVDRLLVQAHKAEQRAQQLMQFPWEAAS